MCGVFRWYVVWFAVGVWGSAIAAVVGLCLVEVVVVVASSKDVLVVSGCVEWGGSVGGGGGGSGRSIASSRRPGRLDAVHRFLAGAVLCASDVLTVRCWLR